MKLIAVLDNAGGMLFNQRRQSQDRILREHILTKFQPEKLWMNAFTFDQFSECDAPCICVSESCLEEASEGDYIFIENLPASDYLDKIEQIILYKWNRDYPADFYFDLSLENWKLSTIEEFPGYSHELITEEIYDRI